jgi:hypothetical protein
MAKKKRIDFDLLMAEITRAVQAAFPDRADTLMRELEVAIATRASAVVREMIHARTREARDRVVNAVAAAPSEMRRWMLWRRSGVEAEQLIDVLSGIVTFIGESAMDGWLEDIAADIREDAETLARRRGLI